MKYNEAMKELNEEIEELSEKNREKLILLMLSLLSGQQKEVRYRNRRSKKILINSHALSDRIG
jgi:hypothetical protein